MARDILKSPTEGVPLAAPAIQMEQHYVTFYSPGTFFAETNTEAVDIWDIEVATERARTVLQRYNATPYGFQFTTRGRAPDDLDAKEIARSPLYYLGGLVETLAEVKARATDADRILISNMECNGWNRIITNTNSWKWTQPLKDTDVVLDFTP